MEWVPAERDTENLRVFTFSLNGVSVWSNGCRHTVLHNVETRCCVITQSTKITKYPHLETTFTPSAVWSSFDSNILSAVPGPDNGTRVPPGSWLIRTGLTVKHARMWLVVKFKLVVKPTARWDLEGHSTTSVKASRRCQTAIISQSARSVRSPERQNRANQTFQEVNSRRGETFNATFTSSTSLKHVGQSSKKSVCKTGAHSQLGAHGFDFVSLPVSSRAYFCCLAGVWYHRAEVNQQPPKSCKLFCPFTALNPAGRVTFMWHCMNHDQITSGNLGNTPIRSSSARLDPPVSNTIRLKTLAKSQHDTWLAYSWKRSFNGWQEVSTVFTHSTGTCRLFQSDISYNLTKPLKGKWAKWGRVKRGSLAAKEEKQSSLERRGFSTIAVVL